MANHYFGGVSGSEVRAQWRAEWGHGHHPPHGRHHHQLPFQPHWIGMFAANYELYDKDIANSPIVQHRWRALRGLRHRLYLVTRIGWRS